MLIDSSRLSAGMFRRGVLAALPPEQWHRESIPNPEATTRRQVVFRDGDPATHVCIVAEGLLKVVRDAAGERPQILRIAGPGDVIGVEALRGGVYAGSAVALTRGAILRWPREAFQDLLLRRPRVSLALVRQMGEANGDLQSLLVDLGTKRALARVASCILLLAGKQPARPATRWIVLPINRREMAALLGLSPETVTRQVRELEARRIIRAERGRVDILDRAGLEAVANGDGGGVRWNGPV